MTTADDRDEQFLRALEAGELDSSESSSPELAEAIAAHQKLEALFGLLRSPANQLSNEIAGLPPGKVVGEFTILRSLASGGMGQVYLARQESLGRLVALKVCKPDITRDPRLKARFVAEGRALAQLTHPNVVPVVSSGEDAGNLYLAMEYVPGPTLADVIQAIQGAPADSLASIVVTQVLASSNSDPQSRSLKQGHARLDRAYQTWAVRTLQQVAQGLAAVHGAGILHRDIKPANIVFAANGVPKIVDFGLARTGPAPSTTVTGEFYGTPAYTSPEQARGDASAVSPASDVFSFGVMLFECLSIDRPFSGRTSVDVLSAILNSDAPLLRQADKRIPWELEAIADKCLRKNPLQRYPSAEQLAEDLGNYLEIRPINASRPTTIRRAVRWVRRRPGVASLTLTFVLATVFALFFAKSAWSQYQTERQNRFATEVDVGDVALYRCLTGRLPRWLPAVGEEYRLQGITAYTAALAFDPNAVWPLVQRARLYAAKKETLELAVADLEKAQRLRPEFSSIRKFRGYALEELGRREEGRAAKEEAKTLYPTTTEDLYWLGLIAYSREQDEGAAEAYFSQALLVSPNHYWSRLERATNSGSTSESPVSALQRRLTELEIAKTIRPDLPFASEDLHFIAFNMGDLVRAEKELTDQIDRFGPSIIRALNMADLLQKEQKYGQAEAILRKTLDQDPGGRTAEKLGDLDYRIGHFEKAREWYIRAINEGKKDSLVYLGLAKALSAMKDWSAAEKAYLDGIAEYPRDALLCCRLGFWYEARGRVADAEKIYRRGCELPGDSEGTLVPLSDIGNISVCYTNLAGLLKRLARQSESMHVLQRGIARAEKARETNKRANQAMKAAELDRYILSLKQLLAEGYISADRRKDAFSFIEAELKTKPITLDGAGMVVNLLGQLGLAQAALEVGRLAEFTIQQGPSSSLESWRQAAGQMVDGQLQQLGLLTELRDRLETRRALGQGLAVVDYSRLGDLYQGDQALSIIREGIRKHPNSFELQSIHMNLLAKAGQKQDAWKAYERARDLFFEHVAGLDVAAVPGDQGLGHFATPLVAGPWYTYLLQEGKVDELSRLEIRLREACPKTMNKPQELLVPRAEAELMTGKYAAALGSLQTCLDRKLANEAAVARGLAQCFDALGRRKEAIKWYGRTLELNGYDPALLSRYLRLLIEEKGVKGLSQELPVYEPARKRLDVRLNATLSCFGSWAALAKGDSKQAFEQLVLTGPYCALAFRQHADFAAEEGLVCSVIIQIVSEKLADSRRLAGALDLLKKYPAERVKAMQKVFTLPTHK